MKVLPVLFIAIAGTCFAGVPGWDAMQAQGRISDMQREIAALKEQLTDAEIDRMLATPAATEEEQRLREEILKERLRRSKMVGPKRVSVSAKMSAADQAKLAATANQQTKLSKNEADKATLQKCAADIARCFPQVSDQNHPLNLKAGELWKLLQEQNSPICNQPDALFFTYSMAAAMLNIQPAQQR